jgi:hypothetical protein
MLPGTVAPRTATEWRSSSPPLTLALYSGGYYISAAADRIIAQPGTITGSIGVIFGKMVLGKFLANKLGVTQESVEKVLSSSFLFPHTRSHLNS